MEGLGCQEGILFVLIVRLEHLSDISSFTIYRAFGCQVSCHCLRSLILRFIFWAISIKILFFLRMVGLIKELFSIAD